MMLNKVKPALPPVDNTSNLPNVETDDNESPAPDTKRALIKESTRFGFK